MKSFFLFDFLFARGLFVQIGDFWLFLVVAFCCLVWR